MWVLQLFQEVHSPHPVLLICCPCPLTLLHLPLNHVIAVNQQYCAAYLCVSSFTNHFVYREVDTSGIYCKQRRSLPELRCPGGVKGMQANTSIIANIVDWCRWLFTFLQELFCCPLAVLCALPLEIHVPIPPSSSCALLSAFVPALHWSTPHSTS